MMNCLDRFLNRNPRQPEGRPLVNIQQHPAGVQGVGIPDADPLQQSLPPLYSCRRPCDCSQNRAVEFGWGAAKVAMLGAGGVAALMGCSCLLNHYAPNMVHPNNNTTGMCPQPDQLPLVGGIFAANIGFVTTVVACCGLIQRRLPAAPVGVQQPLLPQNFSRNF